MPGAAAGHVAFRFSRKAGIIIGLYAVLMMHHPWSGAGALDLSPGYRTAMGAILVTLKLAAELGLFDRLFRRRA